MSEQMTREQDSLLIELMKRLLFERYGSPYGDEPPSEPILLPGALPNALPVELPVPSQSRIVGSMLNGKSATIVFDTSMSQAELQQHFDTHAMAQRWWQPDFRPFGGGGFDFSPMHDVMGNQYCIGKKGKALSVRMQLGKPDSSGITSAYLWINDEGPNSWCNQEEDRHWRGRRDDVLPTLRPPEGAQQYGGGGGSGGHTWESKANLVTTLPLEAIAPHYNKQLEEAGWEQKSVGQVEVAAWSEWSFSRDEREYIGQLFILKLATEENIYRLSLFAADHEASRWAVPGGFFMSVPVPEGGPGSPWHQQGEG